MIDKKLNNSIDLLIKKLNEDGLGSIKVTNKSFSIEITKPSTLSTNNQNEVIQTSALNNNTVTKTATNMLSIDSPMVGIVYVTPKPSSPPFIKSGQKVKKGDTICLIEAMKTFNEIKSDKDGIIKS